MEFICPACHPRQSRWHGMDADGSVRAGDLTLRVHRPYRYPRHRSSDHLDAGRAARVGPPAPQRQGGAARQPDRPPHLRAAEHCPGIVGFDDTVIPEVERAILAGHDLVLLGERGQGKTRLIRTLVGLLTSGRRSSTAARSTIIRTHRSAGAACGSPQPTATSRRWPGSTAANVTARSSPPQTPPRRSDR